jgi:hypothetical protein
MAGTPEPKEPPVDMNRGLIQMATRDGSAEALMYLDEPGAYFDRKGNWLPSAIAKRAGFNTDVFAEMAKVQEDKRVLAEKVKQISMGSKYIVHEEREGYKLVELTAGWQIENAAGDKMMPREQSENIARAAFEDFAPPAEEPALFKKA